ncbi:MAG: class I SAM-dependent rRNA methyltransferase [Desulfovibrio sp.]|nr:class I SAM-dependent rRNA methyltransferase [Desulfovibrio sp.]
MSQAMERLWLKKGEERRLRAGHLWVFSNEVDVSRRALTDCAPGDQVTLCDFMGHPLGSAYVNPSTLISARIYSRRRDTPLDANLLRERLRSALELRQRIFKEPWYRLCNGEGDFLPGLVIDRYGPHLVMQITTWGMETVASPFLDVLAEVISPKSIFIDGSPDSRALEGLGEDYATFGHFPESLEVRENGLVFHVSGTEGQKTGWYYDQRINRRIAASYAKDADVLDACCYTGGFGTNAAAAGAASVTFLDASRPALALAKRNLAANAPDCPGQFLQEDVFDGLERLSTENRRFSLVILDPPALIQRRKDIPKGTAAYKRLNQLAAAVLAPGGVLVSASCSHHLPRETLRTCVALAFGRQGRLPRILAESGNAPDHPGHAAIPETFYLKCLVAQAP